MDYEAMRKAYESAKKKDKNTNEYPDGYYSDWYKNDKQQKLPSFKEQFQRAVDSHPNGWENKGQNFGNYTPPAPIEVDYSIVKMPDGGYVVARSHRIGSLEYDFVCSCASHHEAREIVKALSK